MSETMPEECVRVAFHSKKVFFAVEHIDVLMFGFGCRGETAESAKNVVLLEIRPNILCVSASDLIRRCGRA